MKQGKPMKHPIIVYTLAEGDTAVLVSAAGNGGMRIHSTDRLCLRTDVERAMRVKNAEIRRLGSMVPSWVSTAERQPVDCEPHYVVDADGYRRVAWCHFECGGSETDARRVWRDRDGKKIDPAYWLDIGELPPNPVNRGK